MTNSTFEEILAAAEAYGTKEVERERAMFTGSYYHAGSDTYEFMCANSNCRAKYVLSYQSVQREVPELRLRCACGTMTRFGYSGTKRV